jgi:hypothetical protein
MKKTAILAIILAFSFGSYAQTEKIAHRSHSGSDNTFRVRGNGNFGITPGMQKQIDTRNAALKAAADSIARRAKMDSLGYKPKSDSLKTPVINLTHKKKPLRKYKKTGS